MNGLPFEVGRTQNVGTQVHQIVALHQGCITPQVFIAGMQTAHDGDAANVRCRNLGGYQVEVQLDDCAIPRRYDQP